MPVSRRPTKLLQKLFPDIEFRQETPRQQLATTISAASGDIDNLRHGVCGSLTDRQLQVLERAARWLEQAQSFISQMPEGEWETEPPPAPPKELPNTLSAWSDLILKKP